MIRLSVDLELCRGSCALVQKAAGEGAVSEHHTCLWHLMWQQGSGFALRRVLWRQKDPQNHSVYSQQTLPPGYFCGSLLQLVQLVCTEKCIFCLGQFVVAEWILLASIELWFVMVFMLHEAHTFDPPFSSMAVFNDVNNSKTRYSATLASFPGECVGEANCDPVSCVDLMCSWRYWLLQRWAY